MIDRLIGKRCTGCSSCENSCPVNAIKLIADREGFKYPLVDYNICIKCQLCKKSCPVLNKISTKYDYPIVYAAWNLNDYIRINSTSGGVFSALAKIFIQQGGYVVGAIYNDDFSIKHVMINTIKDIDHLRQSKYAQSDLNRIFSEIEIKLKNNAKVLFCGTPCQSAGLQKYLRKSYENLYCCDFICRGVISQLVYKKFLYDSMERYGSTLNKIHFKNKDYGWNQFSTKLFFNNGKIYQKDREEDYYMRGFLKHNLYMRPSCHQCEFKTIPRCSDISLGDFWGIGNYKSSLDDNNGTSVILINSDKGEKLLRLAEEELFIERRKLEEVIEGNSCLLNSAPIGEFREYFFKRIEKYNFFKLIEQIDKKSLHISKRDQLYIIRNKIIYSLRGRKK